MITHQTTAVNVSNYCQNYYSKLNPENFFTWLKRIKRIKGWLRPVEAKSNGDTGLPHVQKLSVEASRVRGERGGGFRHS
jgi:hypothetical protein